MRTFYKKAIGHSFLRNALKVFSGNILSQAVSFLFLPVFSRIYTPEDYGSWGLFVFFSGFVAVFASLRYELAIMIPSSNRMARLLFYVSSSFAFIICSILFLSSLFLSERIAAWLNSTYSSLFVLMPLHGLMTSMNNILVQWLSRSRKFGELSKARVIQAFTNIGISFIAGFVLDWHQGGLIAGLMGSVVISNIYMSRCARMPVLFPRVLKGSVYRKIVHRYRNFLYYSTPLGILNYYTNNILITIIQINSGTHMIGLFSNANRLVQTPFSMISSAISMVFYPHFSQSEKKIKVVLAVFTSLLFLFSFILLPLFIWGEEIIGFYLGEQWVGSAIYIRLLFAYFVVSYSVSCISSMFAYIQREGIVLLWQIILLGCSILVFTILKHDFERSIFTYSILNAVAYIALLIIGVLLLRKKIK